VNPDPDTPREDDPAPSSDPQAEIARHVEAIQALDPQQVRNALAIGGHLIAIKKLKEQVPHGTFLALIDRKFRFSDKTAENYMNAHRAFGAIIEIVSNLPIHLTALYLLARRDTPQAARTQAIERAQAGLPITKAVAKEIVKKHRPPVDDADPFGGIGDDDLARLTGTFGLFRDKSDLKRDKNDPPDDDPLTWLAMLMRGLRQPYVREMGRRKKHAIYRGKVERDLYHAGLIRNEVADVVVAEFSDDPAHLDLLSGKIERAREVRERLRKDKVA
jgi:hypothetical protein